MLWQHTRSSEVTLLYAIVSETTQHILAIRRLEYHGLSEIITSKVNCAFPIGTKCGIKSTAGF